MLNALLLVITLILIFWLLALVWSLKVAKRVFKFFIYVGLIAAVVLAIYVGYQGYRWGSLLHELNERSMETTQLISTTATTPVPPIQQN